MLLQIFDVEHGACALLTCDNGTRMMIDCGHNSTNGWYPGTYLSDIGVRHLDVLAITNYDEDHVSGIRNHFANVSVGQLWRNASVRPDHVRLLKRRNSVGVNIDFLLNVLEARTAAGAASFTTSSASGLRQADFTAYCNRPDQFDDENNLSMVVALNCRGIGFLFPGDLEKAGWEQLLMDAGFRAALGRTDVLIAAHHGRENGCYDLAFGPGLLQPTFVVISDQRMGFQSQETNSFYSARATGGMFRGRGGRKVITTRSDGSIFFEFGDGIYWAN